MGKQKITSSWILLLSVLPAVWTQLGDLEDMEKDSTEIRKQCFCDLKSSDWSFPTQNFQNVNSIASNCNKVLTKKQFQEAVDIQSSLEDRISELQRQVGQFEAEYDGGFYSVISLRIIEIELAELHDMLNKLKRLGKENKEMITTLKPEVRNLSVQLKELEKYDRLEVFKEYKENVRLKRSLDECEATLHVTSSPTLRPVIGNCPLGRISVVDGPKNYMVSQFGTSYPYGAWGKDSLPAPGKETMYWVMVLSNSNLYGSYIRTYPSYGSFRTGQNYRDISITSSVTVTNSIMGPCAVLYGDAFYYNCYNVPQVCRYDLNTKQFQTLTLPGAGMKGKFNYCTLSACISYTDIDLASDENGLWVVYSTESNFGNIVLSRLNTSNLAILETWNTTLYKQAVSNTFMACGVLYATRYVDSEYEEIFYLFDTSSGREMNNLGVRFRKLSANIQQINYDSREQILYIFNDAYLVTYRVWLYK